MGTQTDTTGLWAEQDKQAYLDYSIDWATDGWLASGDSITASSWTADAGLALQDSSFTSAKTTIWVNSSGATAGTWYSLTNSVVSAQGRRDDRTIRLYIKDGSMAVMGSALFPNLAVAVDKLRRDRLVLVAQTLGLPEVSTEYLWDKLLAAEKKLEHTLRVELAPTVVIPDGAPQAEVDALELAGTRYRQEAAYDYEPSFWGGDSWGFLKLQSRPVISIESVRLAYPLPTQNLWEVPADWIRLDRRGGQFQIVPTSTAFTGPLGLFAMQRMAGRQIPQMMQVRYTCGLTNAKRDYPELLDVVQKIAVVSMIEDAMMPGSGSISVDGLSQSLSVDVSKYHEAIDRIVGRLETAIRGITFGVM